MYLNSVAPVLQIGMYVYLECQQYYSLTHTSFMPMVNS